MPGIYENGTYLKNNPRWHEEDSPWKAKQIFDLINRNGLKPSTICEFGCGAGEILIQLSYQLNEKVNFYGYEISPQAFEICQRKRRNNIKFFLRDLLEEENSDFDIMLIIDVIEHIEDCYGMLRRIKSKARYHIFHIPLDLSVYNMILRSSPIITARKKDGHIHYFMKETAMALLKDTGYEVIDYFYTCKFKLPNRRGKVNLLRRLLFFMNKDLSVRLLGGSALLVLAK